MAAAMPKQDEFKEEFLTCSICTYSFDQDKHRAKCLPCLHTYCLACLQNIAGGRPQLNCPNDRKLVTLPGGTVDNLPNNFLVENLKEYQDIFNLTVACGGCDSQLHAESFCHDCGVFLCQKCIAYHRDFRPLQSHKLLTLAELQEKKCNPNTQRQRECTKHPKQDVTMYCREADCKVPVCGTCAHLDHQGHDLIDLSAAVGQVITDMQQSMGRVNERNQELVQKRLTIEQQKQELTTNFNKKEKEMREEAQKLHHYIDINYNQAHFHLKNLYETEMNNLTASIESIDFLATQMTSASEFANKSCDKTMSHPTQLLTSQNNIMERLKELEITDLPKTESVKTDFDFTKEHHLTMLHIQKQTGLFNLTWRQLTHRSVPPIGIPPYRRATDSVLYSHPHPQVQAAGFAMPPNTTHQPVQHELDPLYQSSPSLQPLPPPVAPRQCTLQLGLAGSSWNHFMAIVQAVDVNGRKITITGGIKVEAIQGRRSLTVQDNKDGTYTFEYDLLGGALCVTINGIEMKGSPFTI